MQLIADVYQRKLARLLEQLQEHPLAIEWDQTERSATPLADIFHDGSLYRPGRIGLTSAKKPSGSRGPRKTCKRDTQSPSASGSLRQVDERAKRTPDLLQAIIEGLQSSFGKAGTNSTGEKESFRPVITDKQSAKVFAAAFRRGITADDELLLLGKLDFDPGSGAPAGLVQRIWSFCDQPFELELLPGEALP